MLKKILLGLLEGGLLGALIVAALSRLSITWTALVVYGAVALVGALVGAVAGKPIWAREAKLEGLLKSLAGAFIAVTAMYGARKWLGGIRVDLEAVGGNAGAIGDVPAAALPVIGALLGFVFQIDDALGSEADPPRRRVAPATPAPGESAGVDEDEEVSDERAHRRG